jgi:hypothetical protein
MTIVFKGVNGDEVLRNVTSIQISFDEMWVTQKNKDGRRVIKVIAVYNIFE